MAVTWFSLGIFFFFQAADGIRDHCVTGVQTCALPICSLICYESIFPEEARARVEQGAQVLVVVTNDAWYGRSPAAWQHLQAARVRAIETGRYLLRAANTGVSAIIAPDGSITATAPWWTQSVVKGTYRLSDVVTPYQKWGDLPSLIVAFILLLAGGLSRRGRDNWRER